MGMSTLKPSAEEVRALLRYDPDTGVFLWMAGALAGREAGTNSNSGSATMPRLYRRIQIGPRIYFAHRLAWLYVTGQWPTLTIDHIDGNGLNNRWANLRHVDAKTNAQNIRRPHCDNKAGLQGVSYSTKDRVYIAQLYIDGKQRVVGRSKDPTEAHQHYLKAKRENHEGSTL